MSQSMAIRVEGLTKRYRGRAAVDGLRFDVPTGSVFGLLGENGAGKLTTIKSILGLIAPDGGRVETLGLDPSRQGLEVRRRVGYVPEVPGLYDWMTVAEIGWFAAGFHPGARAGRRDTSAATGSWSAGSTCRRAEDQGALQGDAGQGRAGPGPGLGAGAAGPGRADLGPRRAGPPRVPGEHGRPRRRGADGPPLEPPDRRGRAGRQPRRPDPPGAAGPGRAAGRAEGPDLPADPPPGRPRPAPAPPAGLELVDAAEAPARPAGWSTPPTGRRWRRPGRLPGVVGVEVETPSLEDIYIAYMRRRARPGGGGRAWSRPVG